MRENEFLRHELEEEDTLQYEDALDNALQAYSKSDLDSMQASLRGQIANSDAPKTIEEFYEACGALMGYYLPYVSTSPEDPWSVPPLVWAWKVFSNQWPVSFGYGSRDSGKTLVISLLQAMIATYNPGCEGLHIAGGSEGQATVATNYIVDYYRRAGIAEAVFGNRQPNTKKIRFANGAMYHIKPGKYASVDGQHPNILSVDEVKHLSMQTADQCWAIPSAKNGIPARHIMATTNQEAGTTANYILDSAEDKGIRIAKWNVIDTMQPCRRCVAIDEHPYVEGDTGDAARTSSCLMWKFCRGEKAIKATGWKSREQVEKVIKLLGGPDDPKTATQAYCERPSSEGLVLYSFVHEKRSLGGNYVDWGFDKEFRWFVAMDPAEKSKAVLQFFHYTVTSNGPICWMFDEIIQERADNAMVSKIALHERCIAKDYGEPEAVVVDPRKTDAISEFRMGTLGGEGVMHHFNAVAPPIDAKSGGQEIIEGVNEMRKLMSGPDGTRRFLVNPHTCPGFIKATKNWMYKKSAQSDGFGDAAKVSNYMKDEADTARYWCRYMVQVLMRPDGFGLRMLGAG